MNSSRRAGRHHLHIPGPSPVPDRILRAIARPTIDHRGPEFGELGLQVIAGLKSIFQCDGPVVIYPSSGTGAWEAALANALSPGDRVLMVETGHFATLWRDMALKLGIVPEFLPTDWRRGADPDAIAARLEQDAAREIKAVCVVHNETSTGCVSPIARIRAAIDSAGHPALFLVDTISSLGSMDYRHDEWGVDVTVGASQKGLMLPPGLSFNALGERAIKASQDSKMPNSFWRWSDMIAHNERGYFPYTPSTNLLFGLADAIDMLHAEGLGNVFERHDRHAEATRRAVRAWGLEVLCEDPAAYSSSLTAVLVPDGCNADELRKAALENFDLSLGTGLGKFAGRVFRIGHLGDVNDLTIVAALAGVEMSLRAAGIPHKAGGVTAAMAFLADEAMSSPT
jgi:alanine-glyoxylate transaminase/serine-glyoxylate transaminase/serine-pyruvate transaminase